LLASHLDRHNLVRRGVVINQAPSNLLAYNVVRFTGRKPRDVGFGIVVRIDHARVSSRSDKRSSAWIVHLKCSIVIATRSYGALGMPALASLTA
jgi:hypothetical protein